MESGFVPVRFDALPHFYQQGGDSAKRRHRVKGKDYVVFNLRMRKENTMQRYRFISLFICLLMFGVVSGNSPAVAQQKVIDLTYQNVFPAPHKHSLMVGEWGKELEKRTNGRVKVTVFPIGQLTAADKSYDGTARGISDLAQSLFGYTRGKFPLSEVLDLPLGYKSALQATKVANDFFKQFKPKEMDEVKMTGIIGEMNPFDDED